MCDCRPIGLGSHKGTKLLLTISTTAHLRTHAQKRKTGTTVRNGCTTSKESAHTRDPHVHTHKHTHKHTRTHKHTHKHTNSDTHKQTKHNTQTHKTHKTLNTHTHTHTPHRRAEGLEQRSKPVTAVMRDVTHQWPAHGPTRHVNEWAPECGWRMEPALPLGWSDPASHGQDDEWSGGTGKPARHLV